MNVMEKLEDRLVGCEKRMRYVAGIIWRVSSKEVALYGFRKLGTVRKV